MADVTTYRRARISYASTTFGMVYAGEVRASTDPAVIANPSLWEALSDALIVTKGMHDFK